MCRKVTGFIFMACIVLVMSSNVFAASYATYDYLFVPEYEVIFDTSSVEIGERVYLDAINTITRNVIPNAVTASIIPVSAHDFNFQFMNNLPLMMNLVITYSVVQVPPGVHYVPRVPIPVTRPFTLVPTSLLQNFPRHYSNWRNASATVSGQSTCGRASLLPAFKQANNPFWGMRQLEAEF